MTTQLSFADLLPVWADHSEQIELQRDTGKRSARDDHPLLLAERDDFLRDWWRWRGYYFCTDSMSYEWIEE